MILVLTNTKGGVGKSTLTVHLATWLHDRSITTAVIDADKQQSSAQWLAEAEPSIVTTSAETPDDCVQAVNLLRQRSQCVICDAPAGLDEVSRTLLLLADLALLPICPSILDLRSVTLATSILRYAQSINGDRPQGALVLNKMRRRDRISRELVHAIPELGIGIANSAIRDLQAFRDAAQQGSVVTRMTGRATAAADDLNSLATELFADWLDAERAFRAEATR